MTILVISLEVEYSGANSVLRKLTTVTVTEKGD